MEGIEMELRDLLNAVNEKKMERDRKICQALVEFVKTEDGRKSIFDVVRAFSIFLERSRIEYDDRNLDEESHTAFFDWLERGGDLDDPHIGRSAHQIELYHS